jgi:hypothetical protein
MNPKAFSKFLNRDKACVHCGATDDTLVPQHRINRGMGGSKLLNKPSNIVVLCSAFNGLIESNADAAALAVEHGIKLYSWQVPETTPVWYAFESAWFMLDNEGNRKYWLSEYN